jgi:ribosomal protein S18 acetylase RimI-like enzyme
MNITLHPVTGEDREFLITVYQASREIELAMTPWDAEQKRAFAALQLEAQTVHYNELYPDARHDIIFYNDVPAGRLCVNRGQTQIAILDITVLNEYRKKGIATALVKELLAEAAEAQKTVRIYVESFNPSQNLFKGLGFETASEEGVNLRLEWRTENLKISP